MAKNTPYIPDKIKELTDTLDGPSHLEPYDLASAIENLHIYSRIWALWQAFSEVPVDAAAGCLKEEWHGFPAGTRRDEVLRWFGDYFDMDVDTSLLGPAASGRRR